MSRSRQIASARIASPLVLVFCVCTDRPLPIPDEFDAAFVQGTVCIPSKAHTGAGTWDEADVCTTTEDCDGSMECRGHAESGDDFCTEAGVPISFETCLYRCLQIEDGSVEFRWYWSCSAGQCTLVPLMTAHILKVQNEKDCDGRYMENPPADECYPEVYAFEMSPPYDAASGYRTGEFTVELPYLDLDAAEAVLARIADGESTSEALGPEIVGVRYPERQIKIELAADHPALADESMIAASDCVEIPAP